MANRFCTGSGLFNDNRVVVGGDVNLTARKRQLEAANSLHERTFATDEILRLGKDIDISRVVNGAQGWRERAAERCVGTERRGEAVAKCRRPGRDARRGARLGAQFGGVLLGHVGALLGVLQVTL